MVGAGPTGLTLALDLHRRGIPCRIVDKAAGPARESRALAIHGRTLEIFEELGVVEAALEQGLRIERFLLHAEGREVLEVDFSVLEIPYPFVLILEQSRTERLLERRLEELAGRVEWDTELIGLEAGESSVEAHLRSPGAADATIRVSHVIGCDGAHSAVRHALRIPFEGSSLPERFLLADVQLRPPPRNDRLQAWLGEDGPLFMAPLPGGAWRMVAAGGGEDSDAPHGAEEAKPGHALLAEALDRAGGEPPEIEEVHWSSWFRVHRRLAARMRVGRVFLAGDAAHIHSPVGGQGMNLGIHDAWNLAWKLAEVLGSTGRDILLDSYHDERLPPARRTALMTDLALRGIALSAGPLRRGRELALAAFGASPRARRRLAHALAMADVVYRSSPVVGRHREGWARWHASGPPPGACGPDAVVGSREGIVRLRRRLDARTHHLLLFPGRGAPSETVKACEDLRQQMATRYGRRVRVHLLAAEREEPGLRDWEGPPPLWDPEGDLARRWAAERPGAVLVRPDRHIAYDCRPMRSAPIRDHLLRTLG